MARLPSFGETSRSDRISVDVGQVASPGMQGAGAEWEAKGQLAKQVGDFTSELIMKRKESEDLNSASIAKEKFKEAVNQITIDAKLTHGGEFNEYSNDITERMTKVKDDLAKDLNSNASNNFNMYARQIGTKTKIDSDTFAAVKKEKYYLKATDDMIEASSNRAYTGKDPIKTAQDQMDIETHLKLGEGISFSPDAAKEKIEISRQKNRFGLVSSLIDSNEFDTAKQLLEGKYKGTENLFSGMDAKELNKWNDAINVKQRSLEKLKFNDMEKELDNIIAINKSGNAPPYLKKQAEQSFNNIMSFKSADPDIISKQEKVREEYNVSKIMGNSIYLMERSPKSSWGEGKAKFAPKDLSQAYLYAKAAEEYDANAKRISREREEDGVSAVRKIFGDVPIEKNIQLQKVIGIQNVRAVSPIESIDFGNKFSSVDSGTQNALVEKFINDHGKMAGIGIQNLVKDSSLSKDYLPVIHMQNTPARANFLNNIKNKKTIEDGYTKNKPNDNMLRTNVASKLESFNTAVNISGNGELGLAYQEAVTLEAKKRINAGEKNEVKAVEEAYKSVIDKTYIKPASDNAKVFIPIKTGITKEKAENFFNSYYKNPKDLGIEISDIPGIKDAKELEQALKQHTKFVSDGTEEGVNLMLLRDDGIYYPLANRKTGKVINRKYGDIK